MIGRNGVVRISALTPYPGPLQGLGFIPMDDGANPYKVAMVQFKDFILQGQAISLNDYGAKGDGVTDNTAAIAKALVSGIGVIHVPVGVFCYSAPFTIPDGQVWVGESSYRSVLRSTFLSGDCITLGATSAITGVKFDSIGQRLSGATIGMAGSNSSLSNFEIDGAYLGVSAAGSSHSQLCVAPSIADGSIRMFSTLPGSGGVDIQNFASAKVRGLTITGTPSGAQCDFGVRVRNGDTALLSGINATRVGRALFVDPADDESVFALNATGCYFDSAAEGVDSALISSSGVVANTLFSNCWFGLAGRNGMTVAPFGDGYVDGLTFTGCEFTANQGFGLVATGASCRNMVVSGGHAGGNGGAAINVVGAQDFVINGFRAGNIAARGPNAFGITVSGSANGYSITGNNLRGNTGSGLGDSGTGTNKIVSGNLV